MPRPRDIRIIKSRRFHRLQRRHFILFDVLPFLSTLAPLALLLVGPTGALEISLFLGPVSYTHLTLPTTPYV